MTIAKAILDKQLGSVSFSCVQNSTMEKIITFQDSSSPPYSWLKVKASRTCKALHPRLSWPLYLYHFGLEARCTWNLWILVQVTSLVSQYCHCFMTNRIVVHKVSANFLLLSLPVNFSRVIVQQQQFGGILLLWNNWNFAPVRFNTFCLVQRNQVLAHLREYNYEKAHVPLRRKNSIYAARTHSKVFMIILFVLFVLYAMWVRTNCTSSRDYKTTTLLILLQASLPLTTISEKKNIWWNITGRMRGRNENLEIHVQACRSNLTISNHQSQESFLREISWCFRQSFPPFWKKGAKMARNIKSVREDDVKFEF